MAEKKRWCADCEEWLSHWGKQHEGTQHHLHASHEKHTHFLFHLRFNYVMLYVKANLLYAECPGAKKKLAEQQEQLGLK